MKSKILILTFILITNSIVYGQEIQELDSNGDGKIDKWLYFSGFDLIKMEEDFDSDGKVDKRAIFFYENGEKYKVEIDSNMDGKADGSSFHKSGFRYLIESDTNYDGVYDYVIDNIKNITTIDSNYDGKVDIQEFVDHRDIDENFDGIFEHKEDKELDLETWLLRYRADYASYLQQYMKNTNYKSK